MKDVLRIVLGFCILNFWLIGCGIAGVVVMIEQKIEEKKTSE